MCLVLLVRGKDRLAVEFDAVARGVGPAACDALSNAAALSFRGNSEHGDDKFGEIGCGIHNRFRKRPQARAGALHIAGDHQKIGRIAREAANGWGDDNIAGREGGYQLLKLRPLGSRAPDLLAERFSAAGRAELGKPAR